MAEQIEPPETPDTLKTALWLWHHSREHREALLKPPVLVAYLFIALGAYWFGSSRNAEELSIKNERLVFANEQLAAYKDRLSGATPDQAAKEIRTLRDKVEASNQKINMMFPEKPRRLNQKQKDVFTGHKDELAKLAPILHIYAWYVGDSARFGSDFALFFSDNLKMPVFGPISTVCDETERGVLVGLPNVDKPSDNAVKFKNILEEAELSPKYTSWNGSPGSQFEFDLFICPE
jgi:hypothetical protein